MGEGGDADFVSSSFSLDLFLGDFLDFDCFCKCWGKLKIDGTALIFSLVFFSEPGGTM